MPCGTSIDMFYQCSYQYPISSPPLDIIPDELMFLHEESARTTPCGTSNEGATISLV